MGGERPRVAAALGAALVLTIVGAGQGQPRWVTVNLGVTPEPPQCVTNPGGVADILWDIEGATLPAFVHFKLWADGDPGTLLDEDVYYGTAGLTASREWSVPSGSQDDKYWVCVEYLGSRGTAVSADAALYVCSDAASLHATKFADSDCDGEKSAGDLRLEGCWICLKTPYGGTFCRQTDSDGAVFWTSIPTGDCRVFESMPSNWVAIWPASYDITLDGPVALEFLNQDRDLCASHVERGSWGVIKGLYR